MRIRRIIIYDRKKVKYSMVLEEIRRHIKKSPIFIGTSIQWNKFLEDCRIDKLNTKESK